MDKCICWHHYPLTGRTVCWGTKEMDDCSCGGDKTKCDLYDHVRKEGQGERNKEIVEYEFEVGDIVITSTGKMGIIDEICKCDRCASRGFFEPIVSVLVGNDAIYITDNDKRTNFRSFYKIGKHVFGNIDMDDVKSNIDIDTRVIDEATDRLKNHRKQLHILEKLAELKGE